LIVVDVKICIFVDFNDFERFFVKKKAPAAVAVLWLRKKPQNIFL